MTSEGEALSKSPDRRKRIMLVVGEASGDLYGAQLVRQLLEQDPTLDIFGVAGENLKQAGIRVVFEVSHLTGMGFTELARNLKNLWQAYWLLRRLLREERPDLLILIDFPEFNLRLAGWAKKLGIPVLYYISPQVWAWRPRRTRKIARLVSRLAVVFAFEVSLYESVGALVTFVGHPLLELVHVTRPREATLRRYGLDPDKKTIAMLPGSRQREVEHHLPRMIRAAERLNREKGIQFILPRASTVGREYLEAELAGAAVPIPIADEDTYNVVGGADLVWVASGTATLETALLQKPMIVVYRVSWITYTLARLLVRVKHIGMVNIIAGDRVVPELIQSGLTEQRIVAETESFLSDPKLYRRTVARLGEVRQRLGSPGAPTRVAELAFSLMKP